MTEPRPLPLHLVTLVMGIASVPLAFAGHLVSLSLVLSGMALGARALGMAQIGIRGRGAFTGRSLKLSRLGSWAAVVGLTAAVLMWWAYATDRLPLSSGA